MAARAAPSGEVAGEGAGVAVGVDVGGTKLVAGRVAADGTVLRRVRRDTPRDPRAGQGPDHDRRLESAAAVTDVIVEVVAELSEGVAGLPVGVGAAGIVDPAGTVRYAPNIPAWDDYPLGTELRRRLAGAVTVENDANAAAWAEHRVGAGAQASAGGWGSSMVMLTVGTGVGGGLVLDGRLVRGAHGLGAEFGHLVVQEGGPPCSCGNLGCLEALASGTAIGRAAERETAAGLLAPGSLLAAAERPLTGKAVTHAAQAGDDLAVGILRECGFWLGVGVACLVNALDPDLVVVGGGAMEAGDLLLEPARRSFTERVMGRAHRELPPVEPAALADDAGLVGAALLALEAVPPQAKQEV